MLKILTGDEREWENHKIITKKKELLDNKVIDFGCFSVYFPFLMILFVMIYSARKIPNLISSGKNLQNVKTSFHCAFFRQTVLSF